MDTQTLQHFITLAETLHFTRASSKALIAQPALSRQIRQLEDSIGVELFKRNKRNAALTKAGAYFKGAAEQTLHRLDYAIERARQIHNGEVGDIRIGYTHSVVQTILPKIIKKLLAEFPGIKTILREMNNTDQYKDLADQRLDIGFVTNPIVPAILKSSIFFEDIFVLVLPENHRLARKRFKSLSAFAEEPFILPHRIDGSDYVHIVESICLDAGFLPNTVHHTASVSSALKLVEAGLGITIEPRASLSGMHLALKYIELAHIPQKAHSAILWSENTETEYLPVLQSVRKLIG
jgi:DNA-binding transcriptional LysR family regulator